MHTEVQLINEAREETIREVEANRMAKALRKRRTRDSDSPAATFATALVRELKLDLFRFVGIFGRVNSKGKARSRKARS